VHSYERVWSLANDDSIRDYLQLQLNGATGAQVYSRYNSGANGTVNNILLASTLNKIAVGVSGTSLRVSSNGNPVQAGTLTTAIEDITKLNIGSSDSQAYLINGHIKQIQYYPKRLSNEELELLTQPSASPTMNLTFDGQATSTLVEGLHD
jgi:hypothetical protein